jgi:hypothetical protein
MSKIKHLALRPIALAALKKERARIMRAMRRTEREIAWLIKTIADLEGDEKRLLKRRMKSCGMSYRRMAPRLGVHFVYLCEILNGRRMNSGRALCARLDAELKRMEGDETGTGGERRRAS